jgi:uncharacterized cofD-like protein
VRVVAVGGGTGLSTLLRGLKNFDVDITAIVTVTDEGGSSGILRRELNVPPPGDIRNNFVALSENEEFLEKFLNFRFRNGSLKGHTVGNIVLAALTMITGNLTKAIEVLSEILAIKGKIYPSSNELVRLVAEMNDGSEIVGEVDITRCKKKIRSIRLDRKVKALPEVVNALQMADVIVLGPGSLYTSIIANLLVEGVPEAVKGSNGITIYVANLMTQPGETDGMKLSDHVREVEKYLGKGVDYVVANSGIPQRDVLERYEREGYELLELDLQNVDRPIIVEHFLTTVVDPFDGKPKVRHDPEKLARAILRIAG